MKLVAVVVPKWTAVAPMRPVPVIVTVVPPLVVPDVGVNEVMVGVGAMKVYVAVPDVAVPPAVVTWTLTAPATWDLVTALTVGGTCHGEALAAVVAEVDGGGPDRTRCR